MFQLPDSSILTRLCLLLSLLAGNAGCQLSLGQQLSDTEAPDIRSIEPDLVVPKLIPLQETAEPGKLQRPGTRQAFRLDARSDPESEYQQLSYIVYLPQDFDARNLVKRYPVILELAGNGGYKNRFGDLSHGVPENSQLGFGITGGRECIWVCVPFVRRSDSTRKNEVATRWWGNPPDYDPRPTVDLCKKVVAEVCRRHRGDSRRVVLAGFSRGSIACNYIGLYDDDIASLWCGFVAYSHYDGVRHWSLPEGGKEFSLKRIRRLNGRPQFICAESSSLAQNVELEKTREWIKSTGIKGDFTFVSTGFRNHNDAWVLRPSPARAALRKWFARVVTREGADAERESPPEAG